MYTRKNELRKNDFRVNQMRSTRAEMHSKSQLIQYMCRHLREIFSHFCE